MKTQIILFLFLFFGSAEGYAQGRDSTARISIHIKPLKKQILQVNFKSKKKHVIPLDSNGYGTVLIDIKEPLFVNIDTEDSTCFELLMEPGYDIQCEETTRHKIIEGKGSAASIYLLQAKVLLDSLSASTNEQSVRNKNPDDFLRVTQEFEFKFNQFHQRFTDSLYLSAPINYLLKNRLMAALLLIKQRFVLPMTIAEVDSLDLENKLGLLTTDLFKDSLLVRSGHYDFWNFLIFSNDNPAYRLYLQYPEKAIFPLLYVSALYKDVKYSRPVKEYLLYSFIDSQLANSGINPMTENLCDLFFKLYPASDYNEFLKRHIAKLTDLIQGNTAPLFVGKTVNGKTTSLIDFKGKLLLIDVWATWCGPCKTELPYTHKIQEMFATSKDFSVLYISIDSDTTRWKNYLAKNTWLTGNHILINDKRFSKAYKITGIPRYMLIDKKGNIIDVFAEHPSKGKLENRIRELLIN